MATLISGLIPEALAEKLVRRDSLRPFRHPIGGVVVFQTTKREELGTSP
jgi:hypothetical protein